MDKIILDETRAAITAAGGIYGIPPIAELEATPRVRSPRSPRSPLGKLKPSISAGFPVADSESSYGTPPPTPDSDAGGVARRQPKILRPLGGETMTSQPQPGSPGAFPKRTHSLSYARKPSEPPAQSESPVSLEPKAEVASPKRAHAGSLAHTREERLWLHKNYRGEAPFLEAWGLDISRQSDREEGLGILRELMLEDSNRAPVASVSASSRGEDSRRRRS